MGEGQAQTPPLDATSAPLQPGSLCAAVWHVAQASDAGGPESAASGHAREGPSSEMQNRRKVILLSVSAANSLGLRYSGKHISTLGFVSPVAALLFIHGVGSVSHSKVNSCGQPSSLSVNPAGSGQACFMGK